VVPRGLDRLCAIQVWFAGGKRHRDYLILARRNGQWWARSLATAAKASGLDLRKRSDAARLEKALLAVDLSGE
jgi:hypothetical protein